MAHDTLTYEYNRLIRSYKFISIQSTIEIDKWNHMTHGYDWISNMMKEILIDV